VPYKYPNYPSQARRLADAGTSLLEALSDPLMDRAIAIVDLEAATSSELLSTNLRAGFEGTSEKPVITLRSPEDVLSGILLELQSANTLMAAGLAMNELGGGAESRFLSDTVAQIRSTSSDMGSHISKSASMRFAPQTEASATVAEAVKLFGDSASRAIESIADGTENVISSAFAKLKEVDQTKVSQAIDNLGESFEVVATVGRLIGQGLEKLKAVLNALSNLCGADALADIRAKVREIWQKFNAGQTLVRTIIGVPTAQRRVADFAARPTLGIVELDGVSRDLALLEDKYQGKRKILNGLESAVALALGIVGALQVFGLWAATPWVALAAGGAYASIIGGALLVGMNYTGSRPLFGWIRGVCEILQKLDTPKEVQ
jgi:hypothetical protein